MAGDDDGGVDRAAILARRQRFIALALSGLAAACGDDNSNSTSPMPCLDVAPQTESSTMTGPTETGASASMSSTSAATDATGSTGTPMPCLDVQPPTSSDDTGASDSTSSTGTGTDTGADTGADSSTGKPQPCLAPGG